PGSSRHEPAIWMSSGPWGLRHIQRGGRTHTQTQFIVDSPASMGKYGKGGGRRKTLQIWENMRGILSVVSSSVHIRRPWRAPGRRSPGGAPGFEAPAPQEACPGRAQEDCHRADAAMGGPAASFGCAPPARDGTFGEEWAAPDGRALCGVAPRPTTVMMRNVPNGYTRDGLIALIEGQGFSGKFDFVYLPLDFKSMLNMGYAFVNLINPEEATRFVELFTGFCQWLHSQSQKICSVSWAETQGLPANVENLRRNLFMRNLLTEECKPVIFCNGRRVPFPRSYKKLRYLALALRGH
ncbi:unnamed protein product, partial [Prorocentrum cordatum]